MADLVEEEVQEFLKGTVLEDAPVVNVSSVTGQGVPELLERIDSLTGSPAQGCSGPPRLPVDRIFP